jgi:hypothetical protein
MRGCALRKVVRNLAHKKLENRGAAEIEKREEKAASIGGAVRVSREKGGFY